MRQGEAIRTPRGPQPAGRPIEDQHRRAGDRSKVELVRRGPLTTRPVKDEFYGDRAGQVQDPFGHRWYVSTHKEDLTMEEIDECVLRVLRLKERLGLFDDPYRRGSTAEPAETVAARRFTRSR